VRGAIIKRRRFFGDATALSQKPFTIRHSLFTIALARTPPFRFALVPHPAPFHSKADHDRLQSVVDDGKKLSADFSWRKF